MESKKKEEEEPDLDPTFTINNRYFVHYRLGKGGFGKVYLVHDIKTNEIYALKVLYKNISEITFKREVAILRLLGKNDSKYILKLHDEGNFIVNDSTKRNYILIDYASNGDLYHYIKCSNGLGEEYAKILFKKILLGIQYCHKKNICHLDIKIANILLDDKYNPIINDFGLSRAIKKEGIFIPYKGEHGTKYMMCPQMFEEKSSYYGIDADIFGLGVLLYEIVLNKRGFINAKDESYDNIKIGNYQKYWEENLDSRNLSKEFKDLFIKMVAYEPKERLSINKILEHPWFNSINDKSKEEYIKFENEFINYMNGIKEKIKNANQISMNIPQIKEEEKKSSTKVISFDAKNKYFKNDKLKPKKISNINNYKYFIKLKGYLNEVDFMNLLCHFIYLKYGLNCFIEESKTKLKFQVYFKNTNNEEKNEEEEEYKKKLFCIMEIKLFEGEDEYLLCFDKRQGNLEDFYEHFLELKNIVGNIFE